MKELCELYTEVNMLLDVAKMWDNHEFKSIETKGWIEGTKFAYNKILKLIEERVKDEEKTINTK